MWRSPTFLSLFPHCSFIISPSPEPSLNLPEIFAAFLSLVKLFLHFSSIFPFLNLYSTLSKRTVRDRCRLRSQSLQCHRCRCRCLHLASQARSANGGAANDKDGRRSHIETIVDGLNRKRLSRNVVFVPARGLSEQSGGGRRMDCQGQVIFTRSLLGRGGGEQ